MPLAVDDVGARRVEVAGSHQRALDTILYLLHLHRRAMGQLQADCLGQGMSLRRTEFARRRAGNRDRTLDLRQVERRQAAVALAQ